MKQDIKEGKKMDPNQNPYENPYNNQNNTPYGNNPYNNPMPHGMYQKPNYMETTALVLAVLSIVTCSCCYLSLPCAGIAIVLALLSRGGEMKLGSKAKLAIVLGIAGLLITVVFYIVVFAVALEMYGGWEGLLRESCEMQGLDFDALFGDYFK